MYENVLVGADPELFLINTEGVFIPSIGLIGGTKRHPKPIDNEGSFVQEDNVAVEFNIAPAKTKEEFVSRIHKVISHLDEEVAKMGLSLNISASANFLPEHLESHAAKEFGCEPDMNCWTMEENQRPQTTDETLRSCGGHIHVGWDKPTMVQRINMGRALDLFVALPAIQFDSDVKRRKLYGKAGACRFKKYGVEHRTSSNFWIKSKEMTEWAYNQVQKAVDFLNNGGTISDNTIIQDTINYSMQENLPFIMSKYGV